MSQDTGYGQVQRVRDPAIRPSGSRIREADPEGVKNTIHLSYTVFQI